MLRALSNHFDGFCAGGSATASVLSLMLSTMVKDFNVQICWVTGDMLMENIAWSFVYEFEPRANWTGNRFLQGLAAGHLSLMPLSFMYSAAYPLPGLAIVTLSPYHLPAAACSLSALAETHFFLCI